MGELVKTQNNQPQTDKPKAKPWLITRDESGRLVGTPAREPEGISNPGSYMRAAFSKPKDEDDKKEQFKRMHHKYNCFHCMDGGTHTLDIETPMGVYPMGFACNCETGDKYAKSTASIDQAIAAGVYKLSCQLAGVCNLETKDPKCYRHVCTRFGAAK